ncbi:MAG: RnfH family protein [Gammaproteobacteria bacterium]
MITVTVVYATPTHCDEQTLQLPIGTTVQQALSQSSMLQKFPEIDLARFGVGIFSQPVNLSYPLKTGDRIEIYRPLLVDPKQARRRRV